MSLEIVKVEAPTDEVRLLIGELDAELNATYSAEQRHGFNISRLFQPGISFFVARVDGKPAGCGGVAFADGLAEVKRMYVRLIFRGRKVAPAILARLEQEARDNNLDRLVLETGDAQTAAMRFYERQGFMRCGAFGEYAKMPAASIVRSVFFEKRLDG
ncbi:MAG TPA: GNAT family N-acetyltransferase [Tepidisphaeraceae bacterium]|nr:GNAT family N-acetyltransferase [Tepidisphaeraceae bacterium]